MEKHTFEVLDLPKVLEKIASFAVFPSTKDRIRGLEPSTDKDKVQEELQLVSEAFTALYRVGEPPLAGIREEVEQALRRTEKGAVFPLELFVPLAKTVRALSRLKAYLRDLARGNLAQMARLIRSHEEVLSLIFSIVDEEGNVKDTASENLKSIRQRIRKLETAVEEKYKSYLTSPRYRSLLQDTVIVTRGGMKTLPVKASALGALRGLVVDRSGSGSTLFVVPDEVLNLINSLNALRSAERKEVEKIVRGFSEKLAPVAGEIADSIEVAKEVDFIFTKAKFAKKFDCTVPEIWDKPAVKIVKARHPLLAQPVPITVEVGDRFSCLVITGPNTGGKTVTLKTIGLFVILAQMGVPVPAGRMETGIFTQVFADIGDEQSIEQNLSTFSSHVGNIARFLKEAQGERTLVLLDELGAGTDPTEGSALGIAILEFLKEKDARVVATTHFSEIKLYAFQTEGMEIASMEFDPKTLAPTYRLMMGVPGKSHAMEIAQRIGVPTEVISKAKEKLSSDFLRVEKVIEKLQRDHSELIKAKRETVHSLRKAKELKRKYEELLRELETKEHKIIERAKVKAKKLYEDAEEVVRRLIAEAQARGQRRAQEVQMELRKLASKTEEEIRPKVPRDTSWVEEGVRVRVAGMGIEGVVVEVDKKAGKAKIDAGHIKMEALLEELEPAEEPTKTAHAVSLTGATAPANPEIHLRGMKAEDALEKLERELDRLYCSGARMVRIVHGRGAGILRRLVTEYLRQCPYVERFRGALPEEGGIGVTIAYLK